MRPAQQTPWVGPSLGQQDARTYYQAFRSKDGVLFSIGDCAMLTPEDEESLPYIGRIEHLYEWDDKGFVVTCWFFHPEETQEGRRKTDRAQELFISTSRAENSISVITGKCLVLSYAQYHNQNLDKLSQTQNIPRKNIYFTEFRYEEGSEEYKPLPHHKELPEPVISPEEKGEKIDRIVATSTNNDITTYFVKWQGRSVSQCSWITKEQLDYLHAEEMEIEERLKCPLTINIRASEKRARPVRLKTSGYAGDAWDISNVVSSSRESVFVPLEEAKPIFIPSWRELNALEQAAVPMEESSGSEDTTDDFYTKIHNKTDVQLKKLIEESLKAIEKKRNNTSSMDIVP